MLAAKCHRENTDELPFPPTLMLERGGIKIGVIGIAADFLLPAKPQPETIRVLLDR